MKALFILLMSLPNLAFANGAEGAFDGTQPLTDAEEKEAENYVHAGMSDRLYYEMCKDDQEKCLSDKAWSSDSGMSKVDSMMPMVTKAYAMFSGLAGGNVTVQDTKNDEPIKVGEDNTEYTWDKGLNQGKGGYADSEGNTLEGENLEKAEDKTKERMDYCGKLPMVVEGVSLAFQQSQNNKTQENYENEKGESKQRASFLALAKMHEDRADAAKYQSYGWGSVAGCYAVDAAAFGAVMDWKLIAKMGAATLITGFYVAKEKAHNDRAKALKAMADKLPGAGDCNPHTKTTCFCAEETSYASDAANFMKYCVPAELARENNTPGYPCVNSEGKPDLSCKCKQNNSCIHARLVSDALSLGLNPAAMKNPLEGISHLSSGIGSAKLGDITEKNLAMANKALKDYKPRDKLNIGSNPKAKKLAQDFFKAGLPKGAAAVLGKYASTSDGSLPPSLSGSGASLRPSDASKNASIAGLNRGKNKLQSGSTLKGSSNSKSVANPFAKKGFGSGSKTSNVDILDFAERATNEAEISKDKGRPIFEIITYRYKMRAWKEFKDEMQEHLAPEVESKDAQGQSKN